MKPGLLLAAALCPCLALLSGCGAAGVVSAINNVQNTGVGFTSRVIGVDSPVSLPIAADQTSPTPISAPLSSISAAQSAAITSQLGAGSQIKNISIALTLTISQPNTQVAFAITQGVLNNQQVWQSAGISNQAPPASPVSFGAFVTFLQPGTYVFGPSGGAVPPGDIYAGDLLGASASSNVVIHNANLQPLQTELETMLRSGQPISLYFESLSPVRGVPDMLDNLDILGHTSLSI